MRRGILYDNLVFAALIVAAILALLFFGARQLYAGENAMGEEECRESIRLHSLAVKTTDEPPKIVCEPHQVTIDNANEEKARKQIADELVFCWGRWQRGEVELFKDEGTYCNVCSVMEFERDDRPVGTIEQVLDQERGKTGMTYREYLFPHTTEDYPESAVGFTLPPATPIDPKTEYSVVFTYDKNHSMKGFVEMMEKDPLRVHLVLGEIGTGAAIGAGVGATVSIIGSAVCAYFSLGACTPAGAIATVKITTYGAMIGGMMGGGKNVNDGIAYPEWVSAVLIIPHNGTYYKAMGCDKVYQGGPNTDRTGPETI